MKGKGFKCNIQNSFIRKTEMKYLGFWVKGDGVKKIFRKIKAITNINPPTLRK